MSGKARRTVRVAMAAFGLLLGGLSVFVAVDDASGLGAAPGETASREALLLVIGGVLKGLGLAGVFVCQAVGFRDWSSWLRPLRPAAGVEGGFRGARRAARQINGVESYRLEEVPQLRRLAKYRVSLRRLDLPARLASMSLVVFLVGIVLAPPGFAIASVTEAELAQVFRVLGVVMTVVLVVAIVVTWRMRTDPKAEAFLERTGPVEGPTDPT